MKNEEGRDEIGFQHVEIAELYCEHFCMIGHILQLNENKLALHLLGQIMNMAEKAGVLSDKDFMTLSEKEVMDRLDGLLRSARNDETRGRNDTLLHCEAGPKQSTFIDELAKYYHTFRTMTKIEHTNEPLPEDEYFCVNLQVKQRYINPLVKDPRVKPGDDNTVVSLSGLTRQSIRLSEVSEKARRIIEDFKSFSDTPYGCVKLL